LCLWAQVMWFRKRQAASAEKQRVERKKDSRASHSADCGYVYIYIYIYNTDVITYCTIYHVDYNHYNFAMYFCMQTEC